MNELLPRSLLVLLQPTHKLEWVMLTADDEWSEALRNPDESSVDSELLGRCDTGAPWAQVGREVFW